MNLFRLCLAFPFRAVSYLFMGIGILALHVSVGAAAAHDSIMDWE